MVPMDVAKLMDPSVTPQQLARQYYSIDIDNNGTPVVIPRTPTVRMSMRKKNDFSSNLTGLCAFIYPSVVPVNPKYTPAGCKKMPMSPTMNYAFQDEYDPNDSSAEIKIKEAKRRVLQQCLLEKGSLGICTSRCRYKVVREVSKQYKMVEVDEMLPWHLYWSDLVLRPDQAIKLKSTQIVNHLPQIEHICRKDLLALNLNRMRRLFPKHYDFYPLTWSLPEDMVSLVDYSATHKRKVFILKPDQGCQGRGITITKKVRSLSPFCRTVCQVYVENPFLIDGLKFDLRIYVLLMSVDPLRIYIYKDGIARFATVKYTSPNESSNTKNTRMHLTNYAVNKLSSKYVLNDFKSGSKRQMSTIFEWLHEQGHDTKNLLAEIDDAIIKTIIAGCPFMKRAYNVYFPERLYACFELLGFDIILDAKLKPMVLEVNHSSSFHIDEIVDEEVKRSLISDTFGILNLDRLKTPLDIKPRKVAAGLFDEQFAYELKHRGGYRLIYPAQNAKKYNCFFYDRVYFDSVKQFEFLPHFPKLPIIPTELVNSRGSSCNIYAANSRSGITNNKTAYVTDQGKGDVGSGDSLDSASSTENTTEPNSTEEDTSECSTVPCTSDSEDSATSTSDNGTSPPSTSSTDSSSTLNPVSSSSELLSSDDRSETASSNESKVETPQVTPMLILPSAIASQEELVRKEEAEIRKKFIEACGIPVKISQMIQATGNYNCRERHYCERMKTFWKARHTRRGRNQLQAIVTKSACADVDDHSSGI